MIRNLYEVYVSAYDAFYSAIEHDSFIIDAEDDAEAEAIARDWCTENFILGKVEWQIDEIIRTNDTIKDDLYEEE